MPLSPSELAYLEPIMDGLRAALGDEGFSTTWSEGRSLSQEEALDEALNLRVETVVGAMPEAVPRAPLHDLA